LIDKRDRVKIVVYVYRDEIGLDRRTSGIKLAFIGFCPAKLPRGRLNPWRWNDRIKIQIRYSSENLLLPDRHRR